MEQDGPVAVNGDGEIIQNKQEDLQKVLKWVTVAGVYKCWLRGQPPSWRRAMVIGWQWQRR